MTPLELAKTLENRYGNPHFKGNELIVQAIAMLRELDERIKELEKFIATNELTK